MSNPISIDFPEFLGRLIENSDLDVGELDFSSLSNEDLSRIASVGSLNLTAIYHGSTRDFLHDSRLGIGYEGRATELDSLWDWGARSFDDKCE